MPLSLVYIGMNQGNNAQHNDNKIYDSRGDEAEDIKDIPDVSLKPEIVA